MRVATASSRSVAWTYALLAITAGLSVGLLLAPALRPTVKLPLEDWRCTGQHAEQRAVATTNGPTMETIYACDQWSRR